jgi:hypothetical protein
MNHRISFSHLAIGLLLLATSPMSAAIADNTPPELIGVWRGTLGKHQIVACWDGDNGARYYTLKKPLVINLSRRDQNSGVWFENDMFESGITEKGDWETTVSWQIQKPRGRYLTGTQIRNPKGSKLPIRLTRVHAAKKGEEDRQSCTWGYTGSLYGPFNAPRVATVPIQSGEPISFMNKPYRVITALGGNVASVELIGEAESVTKANELLRKGLMNDIRSNLSCEIDRVVPERGDYKTKVRLRFRNDEWLSWSDHLEGYCGGGRTFVANSTTTIDLHSGKEINLWDWFKLKLVKEREDRSGQVCEFLKNRCLPTGLAKRVRMTRPAYERKWCEGTVSHEIVDGGYSIGLNEKGIAFVPNLPEPVRTRRTCYPNYTIPFAELAPYLNKSGLAAVNRILTPPPPDSRLSGVEEHVAEEYQGQSE